MEKSPRDRYVTFLMHKFINRFFLIVILILLALELFISIVWMHDFMLFIIGLIESIIIFSVQKLLQSNVRKGSNDIEYKSVVINGYQARIAALNFRVIDIFIIISFILWIVAIVLQSSHLNQIIIVAITGSALASMLTCLAIVISLIYYSMKN